MEIFIYILIPIAFFLYSAYNNYIKEQQKVKLRIPQLPKQKNTVAFPDDFVGGEIKEDYTEGHFQSTSFLDDKKKELQLRRDEVKNKQKAAKEAVNDFYNSEEPVEEVLKGREIHLKHHHEFKFPEIEQEEVRRFDLREAIIQQTILNRPDY